MIYSKATQTKIDALERQVEGLEEQCEKCQQKIRRLEDQVDRLKIGESPIQPGDLIEWTSGKSTRKGRVKAVDVQWGAYCYRAHVLNAKGDEVGAAMVRESHCPVLVKKSRRPKKQPAK